KMNLGTRIKELRGSISQEDRATRAGLNRATLHKIETKNAQVRFDTLTALADALGLSHERRMQLLVAWLEVVLGEDFDLAGLRRAADQLRVRETTEEEELGRTLGRKLRALPPRLREEVLKALDRPPVLEALVSL